MQLFGFRLPIAAVLLFTLVVLSEYGNVDAFAPLMPMTTKSSSLVATTLDLESKAAFLPLSTRSTALSMGFGLGGGEPPKKLTRENEPDEFFATNTDKQTDAEKIPIAIAGFVFISLPFLAGLVALYSSK